MTAYDEMRERFRTSRAKTSIVPQPVKRHNYARVFMKDVQTSKGQRYFDVMACQDCPHWWVINTTYDNTGAETIPYRPRQDGITYKECKS